VRASQGHLVSRSSVPEARQRRGSHYQRAMSFDSLVHPYSAWVMTRTIWSLITAPPGQRGLQGSRNVGVAGGKHVAFSAQTLLHAGPSGQGARGLELGFTTRL
jgi:hypothetical protein